MFCWWISIAASSGYDRERLSRAYQELLGRLEAIPGVRSATICAIVPASGVGAMRTATVEGYQAKPGERRFLSENWVAPKYFETLGIPLLMGRDFSFQDQGRPRVAIVNQTLVRYFFGDGNPIGRHITFDGDDQPFEIVGVVGNTKSTDMREPALRFVYFNMFQSGRNFSQFALRTSLDPAAVAGEVRRVVRASLKTVPVVRVITMAEQVDASIVPERLVATLSGFFGALGAVLAAIGLYGLLATGWRGAPMRSASAWRWARPKAPCPGWCWRMRWGWSGGPGDWGAHGAMGQELRRELDPGPAGEERRSDRFWRGGDDGGGAGGGVCAGAPRGPRGTGGSLAIRLEAVRRVIWTCATPSDDAESAWVCGGGDGHHRAGYRREHGHVQRDRRGAVAAASV